MSTKNPDIKNQRDRFLAFSFASSDMLLEVGNDKTIISALGATKNLVGLSEAELQKINWLNIFSFRDKSYVSELAQKAKVGQRVGPVFVELAKDHKKVLINAIKMPHSDTFYVTIGLANELADMIYDRTMDRAEKKLLNKEDFNDVLEEKLQAAKDLDTETSLTFFDLDISREYKERIGAEAWEELSEQIAESLNETSLGGDAAGKISDSQFSLLHERSINPDMIKQKILELTTRSDPEGQGIGVNQKTIDADIEQMSTKEASRAILYALNEFERKGTNFDGDNLSKSFESYIDANAEKIKEFQSFIKSSSFNLYFQPIVSLETGELHHYETLSRFTYGNTQEWVMFCEDVGMAAQFDLAVCEKVLNFIKYKAGNTRTQFAVNISGQSIADESFYGSLQNMLAKHEGIQERLSFEITESYQIENMERVSSFLKDLRSSGYKIALDDFGAGAASFGYLHDLSVDYVKIDGKYIRRIRDSQRDIAIVKSIASMCNDLGIQVVAEYVEDDEQVKILRKLGITYGQGYLYSKPKPAPDYINEKAA